MCSVLFALLLVPALTFTGPALMELKRKDDILLILTELTDEALGLAELRKQEKDSKMREWHRRVDFRERTGEA